MEYIFDDPYSDVFISNGEVDWHDYYYVSPEVHNEHHLFYHLNRTGIEQQVPNLFTVERSDKTPYCEIFCITSGHGHLLYDGASYSLHPGQVVLMNSHKSHCYSADPQNPFGKIWIEFCGGESAQIMDALISRYSPVSSGDIFRFVTQKISLLQQQLMAAPDYQCSADLYRILYELSVKQFLSSVNTGTGIDPDLWGNIDRYIQAHLSENISNAELARISNLSLSHFIKLFTDYHAMTPQKYIHRMKIRRSRYYLTRTDLSIDQISSTFGYCNVSHFGRIFKSIEGVTPLNYRKMYR